MERTIGTIFGGLLGLATVLLGHGFGQDEDIAITGTPLAVLQVVRSIFGNANPFRLLLGLMKKVALLAQALWRFWWGLERCVWAMLCRWITAPSSL